MGIKTKAQGRSLIFADIMTGEILCDNGQLRQRAEKETELRKQETARADQEKQRADQLEAKLRELGISL